MKVLTIFMIISISLLIMILLKVSEEFGVIKQLLEEIFVCIDSEENDVPPLDEPLRLSKEEAKVLQGLADMLSFDGTLPDKE